MGAPASVARSSQRDGYGAFIEAKAGETSVHVKFVSAVVAVDRASAALVQHGKDTSRIDWLYRIHYLKWTNHPSVDRVVAVIGLAFIWLAMAAGIVLFGRRFLRR